jgi:hypothetical protein
MAVLGYQTPQEGLDEYREQRKNKQPRWRGVFGFISFCVFS